MNPRTTTLFNSEQVREIKSFLKKYPWIFQSESHFIRCAVNYFSREIRKGHFKLENFEVE